MSRLPLGIRIAIRDGWENPNSHSQKVLAEFNNEIGYPIKPICDWPKLWELLEPYYKDAATFVPNVAGFVTQWSDILDEQLHDTENEAWPNQFLDLELYPDHLVLLQQLNLAIDVFGLHSSYGTRQAQWKIFNFVPQAPIPSPQNIRNAFLLGFKKLFEPPKPDQNAMPRNNHGQDWSSNILASRTMSTEQGKSFVPEDMPVLETLLKPEDLFRRKVPYYMIVSLVSVSTGITKISVQGSHEPSLKLLAGYFQKWIKLLNNTQKPIIKTELKGSNFGTDTFYDGVHFEPANAYSEIRVSPITILAFIEGVLGYDLTYEDTHTWHYKRSRMFKA